MIVADQPIVADSTVHVRDAVPADLDRVVQLAQALQQLFPVGENLDYLQGIEGHALIQYHIEKGWVRLAESEGRLVGACGYTIRYGRPEQSYFRHAELRLLYVDPESRGQGVGGKLVRGLVEAVGRRGATTVMASLPPSDELARFLGRFGFQEQRRLYMRLNPGQADG